MKFSLVVVLLGVGANAWGSTVFVPNLTTVSSGQDFLLDINIDSVNDLYGWSFDVSFDPTILSAVAITEGSFLAAGGSTFFLNGAIDNTLGTITGNADSLLGAIPGVSGGGQLAQLEFLVIGQGTSLVSLSNLLLLDSNVDFINADTADGSVMVVAGAPEPTSLLLLLGACALFGLGWRIRQNMWRKATLALPIAACLAASLAHAADIPTEQIDSARTMANGSEIFLTTSNVDGSHFGKLFSRTVDGAIFAQPLYVQGIVITTKRNVVYVTTSHNNVYAFDADAPAASAPLWSQNLGQYDAPQGWNTGMGISATGVISRSLNALFVVAATLESGVRVYKLHALDLVTGAEKFSGPVVISGSTSGTSPDAVNGFITFNAATQVHRVALALSGNNVIVAFSSDRDRDAYHGWVFSYTASLLQPSGVFSDTRATSQVGAGIWQSGRAPAVDSNGALYFETGNGNWDGSLDFGETVLKLTQASNTLSVADWFTPASWQTLNSVDYDLGSDGPTLIAGTNLVFAGGKDGNIYLMSTSNLGQMSASDTNLVQKFLATSGCVTPIVFQGCAQIMGHVFWQTASTPTLFLWGVHDVLRSYKFSSGQFNPIPASVGSTQANYPGGVLSLSSYLGTAGTGILWALTGDVADNGAYFGPTISWSGTLHAYDASNPSTELWNSGQNSIRDSLGVMSSFTPPIAVNGKVYVPTFSNQLVVYGLLNGPVVGDVNGDSVVNCSDLAILKASYGKSTGQPGFDLRADVNADGVVNLVDLATVSKKVTAGTTCP